MGAFLNGVRRDSVKLQKWRGGTFVFTRSTDGLKLRATITSALLVSHHVGIPVDVLEHERRQHDPAHAHGGLRHVARWRHGASRASLKRTANAGKTRLRFANATRRADGGALDL